MNIYVDEAQHFSSVVMVGWLLPLSCGAVPHVWDVFLFFSHMRTWTGTFITLMHFSHGYKNSTSECYMEAMLYSEKEHTGKYAHVSAQLFIPATLWLLMHYYLVQTISLFHLPSLAPFFFSLSRSQLPAETRLPFSVWLNISPQILHTSFVWHLELSHGTY